jgi:hypothetical protein
MRNLRLLDPNIAGGQLARSIQIALRSQKQATHTINVNTNQTQSDTRFHSPTKHQNAL